MPVCKNCQKEFIIYPEDKLFYQKIGVPEPTWCPDCRQQRRLSFRNVSYLYLRQCDLSGKDIVSNYSPDKPFVIYDPKVWWSDKWNPVDYGQDYDFSKTFFAQFKNLQLKVPRPALLDKNSVNSDYTNHGGYNKNCYMCFNTGMSEDCYYCTNFTLNTKDSVDCYDVQKSELLYECFSGQECYHSKYLLYCQGCADSAFLYDCRGCNNCFKCWNLRNQEYCIENKKYSKNDYEKALKDVYLASYQDWQKNKTDFLQKIKARAINRYAIIDKSNNCVGDQISNCQDVKASYYALSSVGCRYCYDVEEFKETYDTYESWRGELNYESHAMHQSYNTVGCSICYDDTDIKYCEFCYNSKNLFGCISLNHKEYCILNKQYTEDEYNKLLPQIIAQMKKNGEWGEFFPLNLSPFAYNESVAQEYYPFTKEEVLSKGLSWKEEEKEEANPNLPACHICGRNFKIIPQEIKFYTKMGLPAPEHCYRCRYQERTKFRHARRTWDRSCSNCGKGIKAVYSPDRPEKIYCEKCYQKEIY